MDFRLEDAKPLSKPMLTHCLLEPWEHISVKFCLKFEYCHSRICLWPCSLRNGDHFDQGWDELSYDYWIGFVIDLFYRYHNANPNLFLTFMGLFYIKVWQLPITCYYLNIWQCSTLTPEEKVTKLDWSLPHRYIDINANIDFKAVWSHL